MKQLFLGCIVALAFGANAQSTLSIDQIMQGEEFVGYLPQRVEWSENSKTIYFSWNPNGDTIRSTHKVDPVSKQIGKVGNDELMSRSQGGDYTDDYLKKVYAKNGDIYLMDLSNFSSKQITNTLAYESSPRFSGDENSIIYQLDNNLFAWDMSSGTTRQLTDFKKGRKKKDKKLSEQDQWLEDDQLAYFDILQKRKNQRDARKYRGEQTKPDRPFTVYTGDKSLRGMAISPDQRYVVYRLVKSAKRKNTIVPDFVTQSGHVTDLTSRPKVGGSQSTSESWVLDLEKDTTYQIKTDGIEGIYDKPAYMKEYAKNPDNYRDKYEKPRAVTIGTPSFSKDGKAVVNITAQDHKDRWIMSLNLSDGSLNLIDRQHDDAWIAGPGIGWFSWPQIDWLDNDNIAFRAEKTGYAQLYKANVKTGKIKALTKGEFEVLEVQLSRDKQTFFLVTNEVSPHEQHFYHLPVKGGKMTKITTLKGGHEVTISPDEKQLAVRYSSNTKPWELYVMPNVAGAELTQLTNSTKDQFNAYKWRESNIVRFKAKDGAEVPASLYTPDADKKNGAAVIFVHGAGYLQNVHSWWHSYYREYMFHNFLVDQGYTVLAIDFRASKGYGRDWRTGIYRFMGGKDLDDQVDGAKYLVEQHGIDAERIGIYGGSYGGFITLMAMFNYPDVFASGAALRSVTDWAHYNHGYTSPILNTPVEDPESYKKSSPIYFAEGLKGDLLILHGMIDTNVQYQDVVRLAQRLIELKKENWEMAVFPLEGHGFREGSSWSDEYRRIYKLFERTLKK